MDIDKIYYLKKQKKLQLLWIPIINKSNQPRFSYTIVLKSLNELEGRKIGLVSQLVELCDWLIDSSDAIQYSITINNSNNLIQFRSHLESLRENTKHQQTDLIGKIFKFFSRRRVKPLTN